MINIDLLRNQPELFRDSVVRRGGEAKLVDGLIDLDQQWRGLTATIEKQRADRSKLSLDKKAAETNRAKLAKIKKELGTLEKKIEEVALKRQELLLSLPNLIMEGVPTGQGGSANQVIKTVGKVRISQGLSHEELMGKMGWLDTDLAALTTGSRFRFLRGAAALAHLRLILEAYSYAISKGFTPVIPPALANEELLQNGGFFPLGREEVFKVGEDLFLLGTSEPMLVAQGWKKRFNASDLPKRFVGFSSCFRKEAGSYGVDTKGMFRQHQFDKVEMVSICLPEKSNEELDFLLQMQEDLVKRFDLPYQVALIGSGDLGAKEAKKYDIETWFPGQQKYRETHSASNCTDYQTRRFRTKVVTSNNEEVYAHALNATLVTERLLLAIIENGQKPDGSVKLPRSLQ